MSHYYDHIFIASSVIAHDRRMDRISSAMAEEYSVLLIGRGDAVTDRGYDVHTFQCRCDGGVLFYIEILIRMIWSLKGYRWGTLTCVDLDTILVGWWYRLTRRFVYAYDAHEYFCEVPELSARPIKKAIWRMIGRLCIPTTDIRYTVGGQLASELERVYRVPFAVVHNVPVHHHQSPMSRASDKTILVYLGVLNIGRGLPEIMQSMDLLPEHELWIIGDGDIADELRWIHQHMAHPERVIFYGQLSEREFIPLLRQAHIGINLLVSTSLSYYYSLANKFFDYLHAGLPVLTMDYPEYCQIMDEHSVGWRVGSLTVEELVDRVSSIRSAELETRATAARQTAALYDWRSESVRLRAIYQC